ncbi:hypothetical protein [Streptomyces sp. NPDC055817]
MRQLEWSVQSGMVTGWNIGIASGGIVSGLILGGLGASSLAWGTFTLLLAALTITVTRRRHAFPAGQRPDLVSAGLCRSALGTRAATKCAGPGCPTPAPVPVPPWLWQLSAGQWMLSI